MTPTEHAKTNINIVDLIQRGIMLVFLAAGGFCVSAASEIPGTLIITSDVHVSRENGRWPHTTAQYESFIRSLHGPEIVFVVGDLVDNVVNISGGVTAGGTEHWKAEIGHYQAANELAPGTTFLHSYGPGHDWIGEVSLELAEQYSGVPRRGIKKWGKVNLVWFTVNPAAFQNTGKNGPALAKEDYAWLDTTLTNGDNFILLWHVPIRTPATEERGKWPGDMNLSIPYDDRLYSIVDDHSERILAVFNGHIHKATKSSYKEIPVYLCPFFGTGCYCELSQTTDSVAVEPRNCGIPGGEIELKN